MTGLPQALVTRLAALPPRRQEWIQDAGLAVALAAVNVFGGFLVTRRMLEMFKKKDRPKAAATEEKKA